MSDDRPRPLLAGLIGWPVAQSKSPIIHSFWLRCLGIDGDYIRLPVRPGGVAEALRGLAPLGFVGVQATMPHKRACFEAVDHLTPAARSLAAVNTVVLEDDGTLTGDNTDLAGFLEPIGDLDLTGERVTVLGAGGAAAAVVAGLIRRGARSVAIVNRSGEAVARLRRDLAKLLQGRDVIAAGWRDAQRLAGGSALVANASSLGMAGFPALPLEVSGLRSDAVVYDIVTHPHHTALIEAAEARGLRCHDGLEMLIGQAREAFRRFYRAEPPGDRDAELRALLTA